MLFTCAGRRAYLLRYFRNELEACSPGSKIYATDMQLNAPALAFADEKIQVPSVYADNYISNILQICREKHINLLISLNDLELPLLAANRKVFEQERVIVLVSSPEIIDISFDKYRTAQFVESIGLKAPKTFIDYNVARVAVKSGKLSFPLVLKPRWGSGSIGIEYVDDLEEMEVTYDLLEKRVKKSILSNVSGSEDYILIQEKVSGPEYGLDIMNDLSGNFRGVAVKKKLSMRAGETDKAITVNNNELSEIGRCLGENLHHIGNLDCDVIERNGEYYVLELNPRFGGGYPFSYEAGVNFPKAIIKWSLGEDIDDILLRPRIGEMFAKCDILVKVN